MRHSRESGVALIFAIVALAIVAVMVAIVASSIQPRITTHNHLERTVKLTALVDAAMAASLAGLAGDPYHPGVPENTLGDGTMSSTVAKVGLNEVEIVAVGATRGWRTTVVARVNLEYGPRVLSWRRFQSAE